MALIFAGKHRVGAASAGVAIKTQSAAQIVLNIVDFFTILVECKKSGTGSQCPHRSTRPLRPRRKGARIYNGETHAKSRLENADAVDA